MISPAPSLNPNVAQIYPIVNGVFEQMMGTDEFQAVDTGSLVSMGVELENKGQFDLWLNTLARRIGYTIDGYRVYKSQFKDLHRSQMEWGAYVQKITAEMPDAVYDKTYDVGKMDGQSVDQWIINNPKVKQKIFEKEAPYSFFITMQTKFLKEAFLNSSAMGSFINQVFGKVNNRINFTMEELGRLCVNNFILNLENSQHYHLVSMYNASHTDQTTTASAFTNANFLRYAVSVMNQVSYGMKDMSRLYNSEDYERFTALEDQRFYILADFMERSKTVVGYAAYHKDDVTANPNIQMTYWQKNATLNDPNGISDRMKIGGSVYNSKGERVEKVLENVLGIIFDIDAMGTFRQEEEVLTTAVNARARYYNTFWHENQLWFNDMSENGVAFFLD